MKIHALVFCSVFFATASNAQLDEFRKLFLGSADSQSMMAFYNYAQSADVTVPVNAAYKGVAISMQAEVTSSVSEKFRFFQDGKKAIEDAVLRDWYNPEIRFLRFSVQSKVPFFLGYSSNLEEDAMIILNAIGNNQISISDWFWRRAIVFLKNSDSLSDEQLSRIEKLQIQ